MIDDLFSQIEARYKRFDIRYEIASILTIKLVRGSIEKLHEMRSAGYAIRILEDGNVMHISTTGEEIEPQIAFKLRYPWTKPIDLAPVPAVKDNVNVIASKPLEHIDVDEKVSLLRELDQILVEAGIENRDIRYREIIVEKHIKSSDGTDVRMRIPYAHILMTASYKYQDKIASIRRSWGIIGGWELMNTDMVRDIFRDASEKVKISAQARSVKPGVYNAIVDGDLNHLLAHEAFGHASEADELRTRSILKGRRGKKVASPLINLVDDKKFEVNGIRGFGWIPYDDEGVSGGKTYIIKEGILNSFLSNRETAFEFKLTPTGNGRAQDWMNPAVVRMTNTLIEPADVKLAMSNDELIEELRNGLLLRFGRGGEVNPMAGVFTFGVQEVYLIENGEIKEQMASTSISGNILTTLKNITAIGKDYDRPEIGAGFCGKAMQMVPVGACGVWLLIKNIHVGG
ncbi:MAG: TldD/PmbA family protein [Candidatus Korarchaeota archaeon]